MTSKIPEEPVLSSEETSDVSSERLGKVGLDSDESEDLSEVDEEKIKDMSAWGNKKEEFYAKEERSDSEVEYEEEIEAKRMIEE